jgi:alkaline phosphatase D
LALDSEWQTYLSANDFMKQPFLLAIFFICFSYSNAQVIAGPMLGQVELREVKIWLEVTSAVKNIKLLYNKKGSTVTKTIEYRGVLGKEFNPVQFSIGGLDINTSYSYRFIIDGKPVKPSGSFTTKDLWQWRKPAPDFSFITGSCSYFNEAVYDRPGKPYGGDSSIFITMGKETASFMLWLGDNWYTREVDFFSEWGLWYRAQYDRRMPVLQNLLKAMPHYATWDDHDYGPNNIGSNFILKETSKQVFDAYWANPSSGMNGQGIYTQVSYADVDIFLMDNRWWRSADDLPDSVNGVPNVERMMIGREQMLWLKNALVQSIASFKIIVSGSQVLNPVSPYGRWKEK